MHQSDQEKLYADAMGKDALARQKLEAQLRHTCCGSLKVHGHSPLCKSEKMRRKR